VRLVDPQDGLPHLDVATGAATAQVFFHGAHVAQWTPAHAKAPVLWLSAHSYFRPDKAIRGGVPICFPWFGPHASDCTAPAHGFARLAEWTLADASDSTDGTVTLPFVLDTGEHASPLWPHRCRVAYRLSIGATLAMTLEVENSSDEPFTFEEALHTYCSVHDIGQVSITGLEAAEYLDKVEGFARKRQGSDPIRFTGETDRVYLDTTATCRIDDPGWSRTIVVSKSGSRSTVVWNPWAEKTLTFSDIGADQWRQMVCVETANVGAAAIRLAPGDSHTMRADIATGRP
jgi:glucose-6-phosphate 1-epimerase